MSKTEQNLMTFLSDNGICCDTCRLYNKNAKNHTVKDNACLSGKNKQLTVYSPVYFVPINESFMCEQWVDIED